MDGNEEDGYADFEDEMDLQKEGEQAEEDNAFLSPIVNSNSPRNNGEKGPTAYNNPNMPIDVNGFFEIFDPDAQPVQPTTFKPLAQSNNNTPYNSNNRCDGNEADNDSDDLEADGGSYFDAWDRLFVHVNSPFGSAVRGALHSNPRSEKTSNLPVINEPVSLNRKTGDKERAKRDKDDGLEGKDEKKRLSNVRPKVRIVQVVCGGFHTVAISEKNQLYSWGYGEFGQLGSDWKDPEIESSKRDDKTKTISIDGQQDATPVKDQIVESKEIETLEGVNFLVVDEVTDDEPTSSPSTTTPPPFASSVTPPPSLIATGLPVPSESTTAALNLTASSSFSRFPSLVPAPNALAPDSPQLTAPNSIAPTTTSNAMPPMDIYRLRPQPLSLPGRVMFASVGMWHTMVIVRFVFFSSRELRAHT